MDIILNFFFQINILSFKSYIGIAFISSDSSPYYIIFGNSKQDKNNLQLNITNNLEYFEWKIKDDFDLNIDNNLFEYELNYKIISVDESLGGIEFYSINNNKMLQINDEIDNDDSLKFDFSNVNIKIEDNPFFQISAIIKEPNYDKSISLCDKNKDYYEDQRYFYQRKIIDEKILKVKLNFECHSNCESCNYIGFNLNNQKCISCKNNQHFCIMENEGNCYDILSLVYSYYYDSEKTNKLKCISPEEYCPDEYPIQNMNTKECMKECDYEDLINKNVIFSNNPGSIIKVSNIS